MALDDGRAVAVHLVNAYTIALAAQDPAYLGLFWRDSVNFADGKPLTWASRCLRGARVRQVRGPSLMQAVCAGVGGDGRPVRHFLLGGSETTLQLLTQRLRSLTPEIQIVGTFSPPFRNLSYEEQRSQDQLVVASGADIVWVGLGTPKQDFEAARLAVATGRTCVAVGAAFDFIAGTKPEAPKILRTLGLEWLFRLLSEPR
jgi:N-acetylglucosaminyldiphosphoundecaprenol N-acetyl-beta-D-mannosaminyltransferase